jgi:hypothetical protein
MSSTPRFNCESGGGEGGGQGGGPTETNRLEWAFHRYQPQNNHLSVVLLCGEIKRMYDTHISSGVAIPCVSAH